MPATEPAVPIQVESDALKQMMHVEQSETAARKYLDLVVQAFHKARLQNGLYGVIIPPMMPVP